MTLKKQDQDPRQKIFVYIDRETCMAFWDVGKRLSVDHAFLYAYLDRYCPVIHRSGIYTISTSAMARDTGYSRDEVEEMLPELERYGIAYDFSSEVLISSALVQQAVRWAGGNPKHRHFLARQLSALGIESGQHRFLAPFAFLEVNRSEVNRSEDPQPSCQLGCQPDTDTDIAPDIDLDGMGVAKGVSK